MHFSVLQGSIQGALLYIAYAATIPDIIPDSLQLNGYADDHSLGKSFKPGIIHEPSNNTNIDDETYIIAIIEDTVLNVKTWMDAVCLKLNELKKEFIYFGSRQQLTNSSHYNAININGGIINRSAKVKYHGAHLDEQLNFKQHVQLKYKAAVMNLLKI